jgi:hypothetical protein
MTERADRIALLRLHLPADTFAARMAKAEQEAVHLAEIQRRVSGGETVKVAVAAVTPEREYASVVRRLNQWRADGVMGLVDGRLPPKQVALPVDIDVIIEATARAMPKARSPEIAAHLKAQHGLVVSETKIKDCLSKVGLSRPVGAPPIRRSAKATAPAPTIEAPTGVTTAPCWAAGAALMSVLDAQVGASRDLATAIVDCAKALPAPVEPVEDHRADRDRRGRFLASYNRARPRRFAKVGSKFESVYLRWRHKDPATLRVRSVALKWTRLKVLALLFTPLVVERGKLPELQYGLDDRLGQLVGRPYRASTLEKATREWKLCGAADAMARAFLRHVIRTSPEPRDAATGAVVLYGDATVNPWWTAGHARCAKVSRRGKVMPAVTTITLNNGLGTPVRYTAASGQVYLPDVLPRLLDDYEDEAGPGAVRRVVVFDRECHAVAFFKQLGDRHTFIIALRSNVTGVNAKFRDVGAWVPIADGAEVCDGFLTLRDRRAGEEDLEVRVVGFRRRPTQAVLWLATNAVHDVFAAADVVRLYLGRWPCQERQYRDSQGRIGFGRLHGYGKEEVAHVAVVSRLDHIDATLTKLEPELARIEAAAAELRPDHDAAVQAAQSATAAESAALTRLEVVGPEQMEEAVHAWRSVRVTASAARTLAARQAKKFDALTRRKERAELQRSKLEDERERLAANTTILTVDTELDEIMLGIKCMFIHLGQRLLREYLDLKLEMDSLIRRVLTLPGEMDLDDHGQTVAVRIYRNPKDPVVTAAVERAVGLLNKGSGGPKLGLMDPPKGWIR